MGSPYGPRPVEELIPVAEAVIAKASLIDTRIRGLAENGALAGTIRAWAEILATSDVYLTEALQAVTSHYAKPGVFPIMANDVIAEVKDTPPTSSPERLRAWLRRWSYFPFSRAIQDESGMDWQPSRTPAEIEAQGNDAVRRFHRKEFQNWIAGNIESIEQSIIAKSNAQTIHALDR